MRKTLEIGIHEGVPFNVYNAFDAARSSELKLLLDGPPADLKYAIDNPKTDDSDALLEGELLHSLLLEPDTVVGRFVFETQPLKDKNKLSINGGSKEAWDILKAEAKDKGLPIISYDMNARANAMAAQVRRHTLWKNLDEFGRKELTLVAEINGVLCKVRLDILLYGKTMGGVVFDLKTTREKLTTRKIRSTITDYSYHLSAAMYIEVGKALGLDLRGFNWIWVEKSPPHNVRITAATPRMLKVGREEFYKTLDVFKSCCESGTWDSYPIDIEEIDLPSWYENRQYPFGELRNV